MDTLFTDIENTKRAANAPLAVRMRPQALDDLIGQEDALGEGTWLRSAIEADARFRLSVARLPICVVKFQMLTSV